MAESDIRWVFLEEQFVGGLREGGTKQALSAGKASSLFLVTQSCVCVCGERERERERERWFNPFCSPVSSNQQRWGCSQFTGIFFSTLFHQQAASASTAKVCFSSLPIPPLLLLRATWELLQPPLNQPVHVPFWQGSVEFSLTWRHTTWGNLCGSHTAGLRLPPPPPLTDPHCIWPPFPTVVDQGLWFSLLVAHSVSFPIALLLIEPQLFSGIPNTHTQPRSFQGRWLHPLDSQSKNRLWLA